MIPSARVANMAEFGGMPTTVHISGGFGFAQMLHFASRTRSNGRHLRVECQIERCGDWFGFRLRIPKGRIGVPAGSGVRS